MHMHPPKLTPRVQVPNNHILTQNLFYDYDCPNTQVANDWVLGPLGLDLHNSCSGFVVWSFTACGLGLRALEVLGSRAWGPNIRAILGLYGDIGKERGKLL